MGVFTTYFTSQQVAFLVLASIAFLASLHFHIKEKDSLSLIFLLLTALFVFWFATMLDPFLNLWDERFHALVAKNMMHHPFRPTLYDDPVVKMAYDRWDRYHIWLHKQPLFLWQIAICFKLFGVSEFVMRLPDVILGVILVYAGYRSGKLLINHRTGYLTGVLIISTLYIVELISGRQEVDHNDFSFLVYVSLSIWSFIEYYFSGNKAWLYLTGIFSGAAILCKWLVGLLIYFGWFILRLQQKKFRISENKDLFIALAITLVIALPWQIFTFIMYPVEAVQAYKFNALHFTTPLEGHNGTFWYHFGQINMIYGPAALILIIPSFYVMGKNIRDIKLFVSLLGMAIVVYLFFSFTATKMSGFTMVVFMIVLIAFAALLDFVFQFLEKLIPHKTVFNLVLFLSVVTIACIRFNIGYLQEKHTTWKDDNFLTRVQIHNKEIFKELNLPANSVLFNVKGRHYVEAMFYTEIPSYNFIPSKEQYDDLKIKGKRIIIFKSPTELPDYLKQDASMIVIDRELQGDE